MDSSLLNQHLDNRKKLIDADIDEFCKTFVEASEREYTPYSKMIAEVYCAILQRGGKRLRGALVMTAYEMVGGTDKALSLRAARIIEMVHAYLLIVDDICDRSAIRRGGPAAHILLTEQHRERQLRGSSEHFGLSQAINAAMLGYHAAQTQTTELAIGDTIKLELLHDLGNVLQTTLHGQINDIANEAVQTVSERDVLHVLTWKSAYYSFLSPLHTGAILAGADAADTAVLQDYSLNAGVAFQIADDILGTFGNAFESGKSAQDDLKEGKITLLVSRALEKANQEQRAYLLECLGNQHLTPPQHEACRTIIEETGALDYAQQLADTYATAAAMALENAPTSWQTEGIAFLRALADFVTHRRA